MKEDTPSKKLPPKLSGTTSTPKVASDEILNSLLRINNFDSISRESLDIDLSACVTISTDTAAIINANSLSSTDFWRVLDENAQTSQLDITSSSEDNTMPARGITSSEEPNASSEGNRPISTIIKQEQPNSFSGTFLRPDPPPTATSLFSPLKKPKNSEVQQQRKVKAPLIGQFTESGKLKTQSPTQSAVKIETGELSSTKIKLVVAASSTTNSNSKVTPSLSSFSALRTVCNASSTTSDPLPSSQSVASDENAEDAANLTTQLPQYKCLDCNGLILQGEHEFNTHELAGHRLLHKCNMCEREFEQESGLKKHLKTHRSVDTRKDAWKKCPDCGKCLKLGSMWMHRKIHGDNKKYGCDICGQKFVQKINLTHHSRVHTAEKPYECPECQKRFQERSHLQRHQKYHAQTRSYRCEKCGKMYKTERCLKVHNLVHLEQRPFACSYCNKSFISNSKLKQHFNIHTGERPFKCNYCPRDFTNFPNWLKHTRRRHKVDHKTGEHLENIPSYCSKKSTKTAKAQQKTPTDASIPTQVNSVSIVNVPADTPTDATTIPTTKVQIKRKKKTDTTTDNQPSLTLKPPSMIPPLIATNAPLTTNLPAATTITKVTKVKRERKQLTPKQVQKSPLPIIKKELPEPKAIATTNTFPDLHCLSITSAEDLIMEQALEMEECGMFDVHSSNADTDNAIMSSEAAIAMHFKIKNEAIKDEEFQTMKDMPTTRMLCSSLESSPFSSPASIELSSASALAAPASTASTDLHPSANTLFMPSTFALTSQGSLISSLGAHTAITSANTSTTTTTDTISSLHAAVTSPLSLPLSSTQMQTQTLFNQLYFPMAVGMPLLVQPNQVLPSVDTLFFSAHPNTASFLHSKVIESAAASAGIVSSTTTTQHQQKLS